MKSDKIKCEEIPPMSLLSLIKSKVLNLEISF